MADRSVSVQTFGVKKTAVAVAYCKRGRGLIKINGCPIELVEPEVLRYKVFEPILLLGTHRFSNVDIRVRVKGGGYVSQIYAIRQAISKALVAYYQKYTAVNTIPEGLQVAWDRGKRRDVDESSKQEIKELLIQYDRSLLIADPRRVEAKKYGGPGARAKYQKSYR